MAKSDCENILNLIPLYIDNMLSKEESDIVCRHIEECASCKEEYEFLKSIMGTELPGIEVPDDFHDRLMANVRRMLKPLAFINIPKPKPSTRYPAITGSVSKNARRTVLLFIVLSLPAKTVCCIIAGSV